MEYALVALIALLVGAGIWMYIQGRTSGKDSAKVDIHEDADKRREKGDAIMAEPIADESEWLDAQHKRMPDSSDD